MTNGGAKDTIGSLLHSFSGLTSNPHSAFFIALTIVFEAGVLGCGSYFMFVKVIPFFTKREVMYRFSPFAVFWMRAERQGIPFVGVPLRIPVYPWSFYISYLLKGTTFLLLFGVQAILLTSVGWHDPLSWSGLKYDLLFARSENLPDGAHLMSYLPIPALGLYVAYKFRTEILLDCYLGLLVAALSVAIHEGLWIVFYYIFYAQYLTWAVSGNVIKDFFFCGMLGLFALTYVRYPSQKIPLKTFKLPMIIFFVFLCVWAMFGFHISTINNFVYGQGVYGITQWWADPATNFFEVASWDILLGAMVIAVWRLKSPTH